MPRLLLWSFLGFLIATAVLAIAVVLIGEMSQTQGRILATSGTIATASIGGMVCATFRERTGHRWLGIAGVGICFVAAAFVVVAIWSSNQDSFWGKIIASIASIASFTVLAELLWLLPLAPRHAWVQRSTSGTITLLAAMVCLLIWNGDTDLTVRTTIAIAIVVTLQTLSHPILWKLGKRAADAALRQLLLTHADGEVWTDAGGRRYSVRPLDTDPSA